MDRLERRWPQLAEVEFLVGLGAGAGLLLAFVDIAVVRKRNNKQLKMTKQEVKDEMKGSEGDPHVKGHRRSKAMQMSRNRMMAEIATADVVVVNPTHVAVALRYDPSRGAPRVVAKGADHIAAKIRELPVKDPMVRRVKALNERREQLKAGIVASTNKRKKLTNRNEAADKVRGILTQFKMQIRDLKLIPSKGGCFEVTADGELLYSKLATGKFPDERAILDAFHARIK